ncbi:MAG: ATP-binding protein [Acidobacteriia bacterium]|nr:ATP-binding protein [Terriglobia bacterium]
MNERISLVLKNNLAELERLAAEVTAWCSRQALSEEVDYQLNLVLDEVVSNVIRHGYRDKRQHEIRVDLDFQDGELTIQVEDDGVHFSPLQVTPPDITKPINERPVGGLGIYMVRQIMDSLDYRRETGRNSLIMKKRVGAA